MLKQGLTCNLHLTGILGFLRRLGAYLGPKLELAKRVLLSWLAMADCTATEAAIFNDVVLVRKVELSSIGNLLSDWLCSEWIPNEDDEGLL